MKRTAIKGLIIVCLLFCWFIRVWIVNNGHLLPYPASPLAEYSILDPVAYGDNICYDGTAANGYEIAVTSANVLSFADYSERYHVSTDDLNVTYSHYMIIDADITNTSEGEGGISMFSLIVRGVDFWANCSVEATAYANPEHFNGKDMYYGVSVAKDKTVHFRFAFGFPKERMPRYRWDHLENEKIWLVITLMPLEQRIRLL